MTGQIFYNPKGIPQIAYATDVYIDIDPMSYRKELLPEGAVVDYELRWLDVKCYALITSIHKLSHTEKSLP